MLQEANGPGSFAQHPRSILLSRRSALFCFGHQDREFGVATEGTQVGVFRHLRRHAGKQPGFDSLPQKCECLFNASAPCGNNAQLVQSNGNLRLIGAENAVFKLEQLPQWLNGILTSPDGAIIPVTFTGRLPGHEQAEGGVLELPSF